jgi:hypothetical protein
MTEKGVYPIETVSFEILVNRKSNQIQIN